MKTTYYMGIDGGGTYTRVIITNQKGEIKSHIKYNAGASIKKNPNAIHDVQNAICQAIQEANLNKDDISKIVLGIAGYDSEKDLEWVNELTNIEGFTPKIISLNDAKIAHAALLLGQPGIICIAGTGSIVLGLNEQGRYIRNYDFYHNAYGASRLLSYNFMQHVLAKDYDDSDKEIVETFLNYFNANSIKELAYQGFEKETSIRDKQFGDFTKNITEAALKGSQLSQLICDQTASNIVLGMRLVASCFESEVINVGLIGSVANCPYIKNKIIELLPTNFKLVESSFPPEIGAILLGMNEVNEEILSNLKGEN